GHFRGSIAWPVHSPVNASRLASRPDSRMTGGRCGLLHLHRGGLAPPTLCRSPGAHVNDPYATRARPPIVVRSQAREAMSRRSVANPGLRAMNDKLVLALLFALLSPSAVAWDEPPEGTFSIIARDTVAGELGMAVQSKAHAVGSRTVSAKGGLAVIAH